MKHIINWTLKRDGKRFEAGDTIDLTAEQAAVLGGVVTAVAEAAPTQAEPAKVAKPVAVPAKK